MSSTTSIAFSTVNRYAPQAAYSVGNPLNLTVDLTTVENWVERFNCRRDTSHDRVFDAAQENRLQFVITHTVSKTAHSTVVHHMFGYADHDGNPELMSDDMQLYFSRAITIRSTQVRDVTGIRTISNVVEDVLLTQGWMENARIQRPGDIFQNLSADSTFSAFLTPEMKCVNLVGAFQKNQVKMMHTSNESPTRYIKIISHALHSAISECIGDPIEMKDDYLFSAAQDRTGEPVLTHHWFFHQLALDTDYNFTGYITLGDFKRIYEPENVSTTLKESADRTDLTPWTGSVESYLANLLIASVNASMTDYGYMSVRLDGIIGKGNVHITQHAVDMLDRNTFDDLIPELDIKRPPFADVVKRDLKTFMWNKDLPAIQFSVVVDIAGVASVNLKVGEESPQIFERPMYMAGMLSGQWAVDESTINNNRTYFKDSISVLISRAVVQR